MFIASIFFSNCFSVFYIIYCSSNLYYFCLSVCFGFRLLFFASFLTWAVTLLTWKNSFFLNVAIYSCNFSFDHCFCCIRFHMLYYLFSNFPCDIFFDLWVLRSMLFNFQIFVNCPNYLLSVIYNFSSFWSGNILCMISMLLHLLRLILKSTF